MMETTKSCFTDSTLLEMIKYDERELIPAIVQNAQTHEILMLGYMNSVSMGKTLETGYATFWSRSRRKLWMKGETSGNTLKVERILLDCDQDALILLVKPSGPTCHTGNKSCFHRILASF